MRRAVLLAALLVAGCAAMRPLEPPKVAVTQVEMDRLTAVDARFNIIVRITNPNDREVAVDAMAADLLIENVAVGRAVLSAPVVLPAHGETTAAMVARADYSASLRASAEIARHLAEPGGAGSHVHFTVSGAATLDGGTTIPFSRTGEFSLRMAGEK
jgi:LEA14-like dessication related protein